MYKEIIEEPVNILIIENGIGPGGAFKSAVNLAKGMDKGRFNPAIFIPDNWPVYEEIKGIKILPIREDIIRECKSNLAFLANFIFGTIPFVIKTCIYCRRNNIHLIHLNNDLRTNYAGILAARLLGIPCISHTRGTIYDSCFMRFLARGVALFIAVSEYIKFELAKIGVEDSRIRVVYNGLNPEQYDPDIDINALKKEFSLSAKGLSIGIAAMLMGWKGHKVFLKAAKGVLEHNPNCVFFIIGDTPTKDKKYKTELIALAEDLGIKDKIVFTGHRSDIPQILKLLDIVVHTSTSPDPLPGVIIQAMAMARPIIASNCGGVPEMIEDGENGILVEPGNAGQLENAIIDLLSNSEKRERLGKKAREIFLQKFTYKEMIEKISKIYEEVLLEKG